MIKKLNIRNGIIACVLGFTLVTEGGCGFLSSNEEIEFGNIENATTERYYDIKKDGIEFFVRKSDLGEALPECNCTYYVGLRVDENGNAVVVNQEEVTDSDSVIACRKQENSDDYSYGIYISNVDDVELVDGYHIYEDDDNNSEYDISKADLIDAYNETGFSLVSEGKSIGIGKYIEYESNPNGGPDFVRGK